MRTRFSPSLATNLQNQGSPIVPKNGDHVEHELVEPLPPTAQNRSQTNKAPGQNCPQVPLLESKPTLYTAPYGSLVADECRLR
jgi:hypothetical protein